MKKLLILFFILVINNQIGYCDSIVFPPLQKVGESNTVKTYNTPLEALNSVAKTLNPNIVGLERIELSLFGKTYPNQNLSRRLSRVEQQLFARTYVNASDIQRIDNIISNFNQMNKYPNISSAVLSGIENKIFNQRFEQNNAKNRIERLEEQLFGAVQNGDINSRYEALKIASQNYRRANNISENNIYAPNQVYNSNSMTGGLLNRFFRGAMTGFTPSIDTYNNNYSGYNNPSFYGQNPNYNNYNSSNSLSRYRFYNGSSNFGTGTRVTILD